MGMRMESLDSFMIRLASPSPAPGGGAASASVSIVAASLSSMVAGLTIGKKGYEDHQELMRKILARSNEITGELRKLMEDDEKAFNEIVSAWKLPRSSDHEKEMRTAAIQKAAKLAIKVPWEIAEVSREILRNAKTLAEYGNKNAVTDAGCALEFSLAALKGAIQNIAINLKSLNDKAMVESEKIKIKNFLDDCEKIYNEGMREVQNKIQME